MNEKELCNQIVEYILYSGKAWVWRNNAGTIPIQSKGKTRIIKVGQKGEADILGIRKSDGKFIAIEVKLPERKKLVTEFQKEYLEKVKEYGGLAGVATSCEEAKEIISQ